MKGATCAVLMEGLYQRGANMGLSTGEVDRALTLGRPPHELSWVMAGDVKGQSLAMAKELFEQERIL